MVDEFTCVGFDESSEEGEMVKGVLNIEQLPYLGIMVFPWGPSPQILAARTGNECINIMEIIDMITHAKADLPNVQYRATAPFWMPEINNSEFPDFNDVNMEQTYQRELDPISRQREMQ